MGTTWEVCTLVNTHVAVWVVDGQVAVVRHGMQADGVDDDLAGLRVDGPGCADAGRLVPAPLLEARRTEKRASCGQTKTPITPNLYLVRVCLTHKVIPLRVETEYRPSSNRGYNPAANTQTGLKKVEENAHGECISYM